MMRFEEGTMENGVDFRSWGKVQFVSYRADARENFEGAVVAR
jgi:hypothetical protein